ncbi:MAG TPA: hypothetical protein VEO00_11860, partial [Actinomycetota bacterium]|nr:hypothetical protein [Actinomycetota bacterium]
LNPETTEDLAQYKAETFGRLVAVCALLLAVRAVRGGTWGGSSPPGAPERTSSSERTPRTRRSSRGETVVAGALFGVGAGTHLVPVIAALAFLVFYALAVLVIERDARGLARTAGVMGAVAVVVAAAALVLPKGDIGFGGAAGGDEAYARFGTDFDPTRFFLSGNLELAQRPPPPGWYYDGGFLFDQLIESGTGRPFSRGAGLAFAAGGLVLAGVMLWRFPDDLRPLGVAAWGLGLTLFLVAVWFSARSDLYILARFGLRRMYDYASVPFALLGLALLEVALAALTRVEATVPAVAGAAVVLAGTIWIAPGGRADPARIAEGLRGVAPLEWIRDHAPCDARILSNQRTAGSFQALTGRVGVLEGMAPYLRPEILVDVVDLHLAAREFFADPARRALTLVLQDVDYVIVTRGQIIGAAGAEFRAAPALDEVPFLTLAFRSPLARIYRVSHDELPGLDLPVPPPPDPVDFPGYACARGPLR